MRKIIFTISLGLMCLCSCQDCNHQTLQLNSKEQRNIEVIMIMRNYYINERMKGVELSKKLEKKLQKMKNDLNYDLSYPENTFLTIPGRDWEINGPLDLNQWIEHLSGTFKYGDETSLDMEYLQNIVREKTFSNHLWSAFRQTFRAGDEIYYFKSDLDSWSLLIGREGYLIIRNNEIIKELIISMN